MKYPIGTKIQSREKRNSDRFYAIVVDYEHRTHTLGESKTYTLQWYNKPDNSPSARTAWYERNIDAQLMAVRECTLDEELFTL